MEARAPHRWRPGGLLLIETGRAVSIRRVLVGGDGKPMCDVFERIVWTRREAEAYLAAYGSPERCPPPWGDGQPAPAPAE